VIIKRNCWQCNRTGVSLFSWLLRKAVRVHTALRKLRETGCAPRFCAQRFGSATRPRVALG
jgi:hypothetical protein